MSLETKEHIFEPFFTTKEKGTGLGLATVYGIIKQSGGYIWVHSEVGKGTVFKVYFPSVEKDEIEFSNDRLTFEPVRGTETILVVEDEEIVRRMTSDSLRLFGYEVIEAENGKEALKHFKKNSTCDIDLLITDVVMPDISGRELVRRVLAVNQKLNILYISGYTDETILHYGVNDEGIPLLQKPFTPNALALKVRDILDEDRRRGREID
jgi:two-component system cell cycle sensor histidine kinase/response regulator CckA